MGPARNWIWALGWSQVHIYDETTKHEIALLQGGSGYGSSSAPGHSNRVFAIKFHPEDPEVQQ